MRLSMVLLLFLSAMVPLATADPQQVQGNCSYIIVVKTSHAPEAGTNDPIHVRFRDIKGNEVVHQDLNLKLWEPIKIEKVDGVSAKETKQIQKESLPFQRGSIDHFKVVGKCMEGEVCALYFKHIGDDDWIPFNAQVYTFESQDDLDQGIFSISKIGLPVYFRRPLPRNAWHGETYCHIHSLSPRSVASAHENLSKLKSHHL